MQMNELEASILDRDLAAFNFCVDTIVRQPDIGEKTVCCIVLKQAMGRA
jgi:hypothetical protein